MSRQDGGGSGENWWDYQARISDPKYKARALARVAAKTAKTAAAPHKPKPATPLRPFWWLRHRPPQR